ncbi:endo-1,4-beta-xylanase/hypothetical protein [Pseudomonas duriflava]|uniref:Chlorophyllase-like protein n=1 Tax=Pseudomonas duriflava TaxID=459528 RepID=A0A562PM79_9PSED|nr:hypothetical protein [Pseudomonas duriflava]TWI45534.1 endo-1,4-beta-xylanase/hypothetical protein [Pseudomonas duriflava]
MAGFLTASILSGQALAENNKKDLTGIFYSVIREAAPGLSGYTVYRPAKLSDVRGQVPVLLWGNGACKSSNHQYWDILGAIAARGYVIVAYGASDQVVIKESNTVTPSRIEKSLDWVRNQANSYPAYANLNPSKIGVFGTSCGGLEALVAGSDSRVKSVAGLNTGFFDSGSEASKNMGGYSVADISKLHTPTLLIGGGPSDVAYKQTHSNYGAANVPIILAENYEGGHSGLWAGLRYSFNSNNSSVATGSTVDYTITTEALEAVIRWFDFTLKKDQSASSYFLGQNCGLCKVNGWKVQSKNFNR